MIEELLPFIVQAVGVGVRVTTRLDRDLPPGRFDRTQFETALTNLAVNARDAMDGHGDIVIETRNIVKGEREAPCALAGRLISITVRDTGPGIPPEVAARVFEPFFTTKEPDKGTGLGLSQVMAFAHAAGGDARIISSRGGAAMEVLLPAELQ